MFEAIGATLPASDIRRAKAFYREKLGLEPFQDDADGSARYRVGETMMVLYPSEFAGTNQATAAAFMVSDIEETVGELRGRGVVFQDVQFGDAETVDGIITMPDGSRGGWFTDSEGNVIGVFQDA